MIDSIAIGAAADCIGNDDFRPQRAVTNSSNTHRPRTLINRLRSGFPLNNSVADLGLYETNTFGSASAMQDFVQWGSGGNGRESVAVGKGIWTAGDFILTAPEGHSIAFDGQGRTSSDWANQSNPTIGAEN